MLHEDKFTSAYTPTGLDRVFYESLKSHNVGSFVEFGSFKTYESPSKLFDLNGWAGTYVYNGIVDDSLIRFDRSEVSVFNPKILPEKTDMMIIHEDANLKHADMYDLIKTMSPSAIITSNHFDFDPPSGFVRLLNDADRSYYGSLQLARMFESTNDGLIPVYHTALDAIWLGRTTLIERAILPYVNKPHVPSLRSLKDTVKSGLRELLYLSKQSQVRDEVAKVTTFVVAPKPLTPETITAAYTNGLMNLSQERTAVLPRHKRYLKKSDLLMHRIPSLVLREGFATFKRKTR